jgi:hypothetical protein
MQQAIKEHPEHVSITIYSGQGISNPTIQITYDNGIPLQAVDDMRIQIPSNITSANGYVLDYDSIPKPNGEQLFQ